MGQGGTQSNKVHKFALNDVSVSTVLSKIVAGMFRCKLVHRHGVKSFSKINKPLWPAGIYIFLPQRNFSHFQTLLIFLGTLTRSNLSHYPITSMKQSEYLYPRSTSTTNRVTSVNYFTATSIFGHCRSL